MTAGMSVIFRKGEHWSDGRNAPIPFDDLPLWLQERLAVLWLVAGGNGQLATVKGVGQVYTYKAQRGVHQKFWVERDYTRCD